MTYADAIMAMHAKARQMGLDPVDGFALRAAAEMMDRNEIVDVAHGMLDRAMARDDRDLLLQLRDRLRERRTAIFKAFQQGNWMPYDPVVEFVDELLALYPDDLL